jgi:hypothetical protein
MYSVIGEVAPLTPGTQVARFVVLRYVIEMGDGEHHSASGNRMWLTVFCSAIWVSWRSFAAIPYTCKNRRPYLTAPVRRVSTSVLRSYRHSCAAFLHGKFQALTGTRY